jgi:hypothetical protein
MGDLLGLGALDRPASAGAEPLDGFAIDDVLASARALAARIADQAPDLSVTVHDPRAGFRAWFGRRSDPRLLLAEPFGAPLAPRYAASPHGADSLQPALEMLFALDALSGEPAGGSEPVLPPCRIAAEWANDHELGHLADRVGTDRAAWFERFDADIKHRREILADGFAHVLAILRHGAEGERQARARVGWRAHALIVAGDAAHFTSYAAAPFVTLGRGLQAQGATVDGLDPVALARRCRDMAGRIALASAELDALRAAAMRPDHAEGHQVALPPRVAAILTAARRRAGRHRLLTARKAVTAQGWLAAMARANPEDAALLGAAQAAARLDRAAMGLGTALVRPAGLERAAPDERSGAVAAFLGSMHDALGRTLAPALGEAARHASRLGQAAAGLTEDLLRAATLPTAERTATLLRALQAALALAWEGIEHGLLPGQLAGAIRDHALLAQTCLARQGAG